MVFFVVCTFKDESSILSEKYVGQTKHIPSSSNGAILLTKLHWAYEADMITATPIFAGSLFPDTSVRERFYAIVNSFLR